VRVVPRLLTLTPAIIHAGDALHPTAIEVCQSLDCSSRLPAEAIVNVLAGRQDILALSFAVT